MKELHLLTRPASRQNHGFFAYGRDIILHKPKEEIGRDYCTGNVEDLEAAADEEHSRLDRRNTSPKSSWLEFKLIRNKQTSGQDWRKRSPPKVLEEFHVRHKT